MKLMLNGKEVTGMGHYVMAGDIKDATAEDSNVLSGKSYYNNNGKREGTMPNRGGMSAELAAGGSVSIPEGYHNGEGVVRAQDLASQTAGDAGAGNIDSGKTAWVNGVQVTGTSTKVDTSGATATAGDIASGKTAWVNGSKVTGTAVNADYSIQVLGNVAIPNGSNAKTFDAPEGWTHLIFEDKIGQKAIFPKPNGYQGSYTMKAYSGDSSGTSQNAILGVNSSGNPVITAATYYIKSITAVKVVGL